MMVAKNTSDGVPGVARRGVRNGGVCRGVFGGVTTSSAPSSTWRGRSARVEPETSATDSKATAINSSLMCLGRCLETLRWNRVRGGGKQTRAAARAVPREQNHASVQIGASRMGTGDAGGERLRRSRGLR